jgi:hypothetical protein
MGVVAPTAPVELAPVTAAIACGATEATAPVPPPSPQPPSPPPPPPAAAPARASQWELLGSSLTSPDMSGKAHSRQVPTGCPSGSVGPGTALAGASGSTSTAPQVWHCHSRAAGRPWRGGAAVEHSAHTFASLQVCQVHRQHNDSTPFHVHMTSHRVHRRKPTKGTII